MLKKLGNKNKNFRRISTLTKKKEKKKEKLTESLHLKVKMTVSGKSITDVSHNKITVAGNPKSALNEKPTDSPQLFLFVV